MTLDQFSPLVASIYDAALDPSRWEPALCKLVNAFGGSGGALLMAAPGSRQFRYASVGSNHAAVRAYDEYFGRLDPVAAALERAPVGTVLCGSEVVTPREQRSEFYADWATRMIDAGDGVFASLARGSEGVGWLCVCAPSRSRSFGTPERTRLMRALVPHLRQALRMQSSLDELAIQRRSALDALDRLTHGVVLLAPSGAMTFANRAATRISSSRDGLVVSRSGIRVGRQDEDTMLQRLIRRAAGTGQGGLRAGGTLAVTRASTRRSFVVHVIPLGVAEGDVSPAGTLAVIVDPEREPQPLSATLRHLYRLTPTEAAVAVHVLHCEGLQSVADKMSVSISTVRIHLQRVFDKTQTHRQAELARLLLAIEAGLEPTASPDRANISVTARDEAIQITGKSAQASLAKGTTPNAGCR